MPRLVLPNLTELLTVLSLVLVVALLWQRLSLQEARSDLKATTVLLEAEQRHSKRVDALLALNQRISSTRSAKQEVTNAKSRTSARKVQAALEQNRPWADTPVPSAVFDGLFHDGLQAP